MTSAPPFRYRFPLPLKPKLPLKHVRYPCGHEELRPKDMSIGIGVKCLDGVVLGVDLEYTQVSSSMPGQKMFWLPKFDGANYFALVAASGNPDSTKTFIEYLDEELSLLGTVAEWKSLKRAIGASLKRVYLEHIDIAPRNERTDLGLDLLLALRVNNDTKMYRTNRTMLVEEEGTYVQGVGLYSGRPLVDLFLGYRPMISVGTASQIVTCIVSLAKEHTQYVGKGSDIHILPNQGLAYSILKPERKEIDEDFSDLISSLRSCIAELSPPGGFSYPNCISRFGQSVENLRNNQIAREQRRLARRQAGPPSPQSPKANL